MMKKRTFIKSLGAVGIPLLVNAPFALSTASGKSAKKPSFDASLSQWGFHKAIFGKSRDDYELYRKTLHASPDDVLLGDMDPREIVVMARKLGVSSVDLVNVLWFGHAQDQPWLNQFKSMAKDEGVTFGCLMCDEAGYIGSTSAAKRTKSIELHTSWLEAAAELGCTQLRVNAYGDGTYLEQLEHCAESLNKLADLGEQYNIDVLVENHGHPSSTGAWLAMLMEKTDHKGVGVYTDFDNFFMDGWDHDPQRRYDRVQGLLDLAPYTRGVSAKSYDFDENGEETTINFKQCMTILMDAGFRGSFCAEYEGEHLSEYEGSKATIALINKVLSELGVVG